MPRTDFLLREDYWENLEITESDINFLYNYLIELERPSSLTELVESLIHERINELKTSFEKRKQQNGKNYLPKEEYKIGDVIHFPALDWMKGKVISKRPGVNPEIPAFEVIEVELEDGSHKSYAGKLENHQLNEPVELSLQSDIIDPNAVMSSYGQELSKKLERQIIQNPDLVSIAEKWFPKALLVDVNIGYLNLAEALLDMEGGGPLTTNEILKQIDLPTDVNQELTAFSMNYAMQEDDRFDEVGPSGEVIWYLRRLEPEWVREKPVFLQYEPLEYDKNIIRELLPALSRHIVDELEALHGDTINSDEVEISLIYPHWRSGSLPLAEELSHLFPTALQSPRVQFTFVDGNSGKRFSGWVVRPSHYIGGLSKWYEEQGVVPGSLIHIQKGSAEGEVIIKVAKRRSAREWVRTVLVGGDGGIVFAMLKQLVSTDVDERMALFVPDETLLDDMWKDKRFGRYEFNRIVLQMMRELVKLNPQGHVHLEEIYAAVNLRYRCPPGLILSILMDAPWAMHLGDLYFNLIRENLEK